jgi:selenocysteine lyase/cysteine desulfurase
VKGNWSDRVLEAIDERTAAVAIAQLHWVDGTMFDLRAIRGRTNDVGAWLVIDGTQSFGAYPTDVQALSPDALVCGGYKWLMGPYGCGYAYYGPRMDDGRPIEENWINRAGSEDFRNLVNYRDDYRPLAGRYSVGEHSNFLMAPMQVAALKQVNDWTPELVQTYCKRLWDSTRSVFDRAGVEIPSDRAYHLIGLTLPGHIDREKLSAEIERQGLTVSYRGDAVRVSPNVYNTEEELGSLGEALLASVI